MGTPTILAIAPHPDDETLGCGGTLLRAIAEGADVHWLIATTIFTGQCFDEARMQSREGEIARVAEAYGFREVHRACFPAARLDTVADGELIDFIGGVVKRVAPDTLYLPFRDDAHSDHAAVFDAAAACGKCFRYPSVKNIYCYETLSETEFGIKPGQPTFRPNRFVDISGYLQRKIEIMEFYEGETGTFPFPRSGEALRALAALRGVVAGVPAAEAFMVLREIE